MAERFKDQVVWITGGGSGIGEALAMAFGREGAKVAVSGRRAERLDRVVEALGKTGAHGLAVRCDVTSEKEVERAADGIAEKLSGMDVVVASAGFGVTGRLEKLSADDWRRQLDVNVVGVAITVRHALPHLKKTRGRIGLIGSVSALLATPRAAAYTASKYAVRAIGQTLSLELHGSGVSCTLIHPGFVKSDIARVDNQGQFDPSREDKRPARLMWETDRAARVIVDAIYRRKREYVFTNHGKAGAFFGKHLPGLTHFVQTRGKKKR